MRDATAEDVDVGILGCNAVWTCICFSEDILPSSSELASPHGVTTQKPNNDDNCGSSHHLTLFRLTNATYTFFIFVPRREIAECVSLLAARHISRSSKNKGLNFNPVYSISTDEIDSEMSKSHENKWCKNGLKSNPTYVLWRKMEAFGPLHQALSKLRNITYSPINETYLTLCDYFAKMYSPSSF
jgi:hypothetical protein